MTANKMALDALTAALDAMEHMANTLNNMDAVDEDEDAQHDAAFEAVRAAIAALQAEEVERLAAQAAPTYSGWVWKHIKSGGEYELLGNAKVQCDEPLTDMAEVYVYQGEDGRMWARPVAEFNARFKRSRPHGRPIAATANGSLLHGLAVAERCAAEVGAATTAQAVRMLTPEEEHALCIEHGATVSAHLLQAIQRKFCEVNGLPIPADGKIGGA